jgi:hypothetical protein
MIPYRRIAFSLVLFIILAASSSAWAQGGYTDKYIFVPVNNYIADFYVKGYSTGIFEGSFYSNGWTESWWGAPGNVEANHSTAPGFQVPLAPDQIAYLDSIGPFSPDRWIFINLSNHGEIILADPAPPGIASPAVLNQLPDKPPVVTQTTEDIVFTPDPLDPFNIIIEHYITEYVDVYEPILLGAVYRGLEDGPVPEPVPEPATLFLLVSGLAGIGLSKLRNRI